MKGAESDTLQILFTKNTKKTCLARVVTKLVDSRDYYNKKFVLTV